MPYHVIQQLTVLGPETHKVVKQLAGPDSPVDFDKILPIPEELHVQLSSEGAVGIAALTGDCEWYLTFPWVANQGITTPEGFRVMAERDYPEGIKFARKLLSNKENFGHMEWKEWCLQNWGTPWNAYSVGEWEFLHHQARIRFTTERHAALPVVIRLSYGFFEIPFELRYFNEDLTLGGKAFFLGGKYTIENFRRGENLEGVQQIHREVCGEDLT